MKQKRNGNFPQQKNQERSATPTLRELLPGLYPGLWQSQNPGMKGKVATAPLSLAIPHQEGLFCENYIFNVLWYYHNFVRFIFHIMGQCAGRKLTAGSD